MPLDYKEYHPKWSLISYLIRFKRAKNKCEWCDIANYLVVNKVDRKKPSPAQWDMFYSLINQKKYSHKMAMKSMGFSKIVTTVAHIDHDKTNNRFNNLAALCQKCHLKHDIKQHVDNRKYGRHHKQKHQLKIF